MCGRGRRASPPRQPARKPAGRARKGIGARGDDGIEIAEEHEWHIHGRLPHQLERAVEGHPQLERALRARLDHGTVGERIGKWHADLDHIRARLRHAAQQCERPRAVGMSCGDVDDERLAVALAKRGEAPSDEVRRSSR